MKLGFAFCYENIHYILHIKSVVEIIDIVLILQSFQQDANHIHKIENWVELNQPKAILPIEI